MPVRTHAIFRMIVALAALLAAVPARGDVVTKNSGEHLKGLVVAESENDITLETSVGALVVRTRIARKDITDIHKDAVAKNRYCRIPIHGEIGTDVKAEWLAKAIEQARGFGANYIVLDIDSPGGDVAEMARIMEMLSKQENLNIVAHVHKAMSAAAMITITCPTIIVDSHASIGAAVPWKIGPDGTPMDVEAKFLSAYRAMCKSAAQFAHHSPLLAQGMMDMNLVLAMRTHDGGIEIIEGGSAAAPAAPLKKKGEILCLSAAEALKCGLAAGATDSAKDVQRILALPDWSPVGETVWAYMESRPIAERGNLERQQASQSAAAAKNRTVQQLAALDARIAIVTQAKTDAEKRAAALPAELRKELNAIDMRLNAGQRDAIGTEIRGRYQVLYNQANAAADKADQELQDLSVVRTRLTALIREGN